MSTFVTRQEWFLPASYLLREVLMPETREAMPPSLAGGGGQDKSSWTSRPGLGRGCLLALEGERRPLYLCAPWAVDQSLSIHPSSSSLGYLSNQSASKSASQLANQPAN